jgi:hypothetical protein
MVHYIASPHPSNIIMIVRGDSYEMCIERRGKSRIIIGKRMHPGTSKRGK